jgi:two-component sensor histidine kinase
MQAAKILQTASSLERYIYDVEDEFEVPLADYLEGLLNHHREIFALEKSNTRISLTCPPNVILPVDQILNLAIVLDEWVRNTKKFAFSISENPHITILIREENGTLSVDYRDNGSGMKKDATAGIGTGLIEKFTQDLDARITTENDGGIHHCIRFKIQSKKTKSHL